MAHQIPMDASEPTASPSYQDLLGNYSHLFEGEGGRMVLNMTSRFNDSDRRFSLSLYHDVACVSLDPKDAQLMISHEVYAFTSLFCVIIGLMGNALSIMVFGSKVMRVNSSNVYLLFLAISDSLYLISVFFTKILTTLRCLYFVDEYFDISNRSNILCKLLQYLLDLFSDYSTGLILAFTVERYIACYRPLSFKEICTVRRARIVCGTLFAAIAVFIAPYHCLFMGLPPGYNVCTILETKEAEFTILYIIEMMFFRVVPVFIIAILNIFIIRKVMEVSREKKRRASLNTSTKQRRPVNEDKHRQLTIMLILVSSSYIICFLPVLVHFVMWKLRRSGLLSVSERAMDMIQSYAKIMYIFGFAINFFLYTMSGRVFREQLILMLCGKKRLPCTVVDPTTENTGTAMTNQQRQPLTTMNGKQEEEAKEKQALNEEADTQV